jgi:hypothetical protein
MRSDSGLAARDAALAEGEDPIAVSLAERVLAIAGSVRLVQASTPHNWEAEIARMVLARRVNERPEPEFHYLPPSRDDGVPEELSRVGDAAQRAGALLIAARARELALEAKMARAIATPSFVSMARARYRSSSADDARAERWASASATEIDDHVRVLSDDARDPRSLLSRMRAALGARRVPYRVVVQRGLASLAATGDSVVLVVAGRALTPRETDRTVLHEVEGHVMPAVARSTEGLLSRLRVAGDGDLEEGRALFIEREAGFLDEARRKELGLRHVAAQLAHAETAFHDIADRLEALGASAQAAVRMAARALRGGGLGRERVYLPALFRAMAEHRLRAAVP